MTVGNIHCLNIRKKHGDFYNKLFIAYHPNSLPYAVCRKIIFRLIFAYIGIHYAVNTLAVSVCQKNRSCICVAGINMINPVLFLFLQGVLVLFDNIIHIVINRSTAYYACLASAVHYLTVNIKAGAFILKHCLVLKLFQIISRPVVNLLRILVNAQGKIYFRPVDMQKREWFIFRFLSRLKTAHNIIGQSRNKRLIFFFRSVRFKASKNCHIQKSSIQLFFSYIIRSPSIIKFLSTVTGVLQ